MKASTFESVVLLSLLAQAATCRYLGPVWSLQSTFYRNGIVPGGDPQTGKFSLVFDPTHPDCHNPDLRVPREKILYWPQKEINDDRSRQWEMHLCTVQNQMPAFPCGDKATLELDQSDNDCPKTDEELVKRILELAQERAEERERLNLGDPESPVTIEKIYKALHVIDPDTFPNDTPPADLKLDIDKNGGGVSSPAVADNGNPVADVTSGGTKDETLAVPIKPPGPTQDGINKDCKEWYVVNATDSCASISGDKGISLERFYSWNPAVNEGGECMELWIGYAVCVGDARKA